jgi:hypothetical protein
MQSLYNSAKLIVGLLIPCLLISCVVPVETLKPAITEPDPAVTDTTIWLNYFQDRFTTLNDQVEPPSEQLPSIAHQCYKEAKVEWEKSKKEREGTNRCVYCLWSFPGYYAHHCL